MGKNLNKWCQELRRPQVILSDNATYYKSKKLMNWAKNRGVKLMNIAAYAHKSNGIVERYNQTLIGRIRRMLSEEKHQDWSKVLWHVAGIINETQHSVINETPMSVWEGDEALWGKCKLRKRIA